MAKFKTVENLEFNMTQYFKINIKLKTRFELNFSSLILTFQSLPRLKQEQNKKNTIGK